MHTSRTDRQRADVRKAHGVHYTPPALADFLAVSGLAALRGSLTTVLDPACGSGELLHAVANNLDERVAPTFIGLDRDEVAVRATEDRLSGLGVPFTARTADFMQVVSARRPQVDLFSVVPDDDLPEIDLAIANPPYVRTQTLGPEQAASLAAKYSISGRVDLYMAFAFGLADVLRPGGVLAFLCSNRFLTTKGGLSLRRLLSRDFELTSITDFGDTRLFEAAVLPAIIIATKRPSEAGARSFVSLYRHEGGDDLPARTSRSIPEAAIKPEPGLVRVGSEVFSVRVGRLASDISEDSAWTIQDDRTVDFFAKLARVEHRTFGDLSKIRVGIKTTADSVFIREDWAAMPGCAEPESDLLYPLITHEIVDRWTLREPTKRVLYPHRDDAGRARPVDLEAFPKSAQYLEMHRPRLEGRKYVIEGGRQWYEVWVPQKPHLWSSPKVVFPDIADSPRFALDLRGRIVNGDCYWASCEDADTALLLAAVGNSSLARMFYDLSCGNQLYSGRRRFMTQYVERFPVPLPESPEARKIVELGRALVDGTDDPSHIESEVDFLVWRSLGVEEFAR